MPRKNIKYKHPTEGNEKIVLPMRKHLHFNYGGRICIQVEGVAMRSPLGPVLANIFMTELEIAMIPSFGNYLLN